MPTQVDITVNAGGGADWTTLQDAFDDIVSAATGADLVANDENVVITVASGTTYTEIGTLMDEGLTCDATRNVTVRPASGSEGDGTPASGPYFAPSSGTAAILDIRDSFTVIEGISFKSSPSHFYNTTIQLGGGAITGGTTGVEGIEFRRCVVTGDASSTNEGGVQIAAGAGSSTNPIRVVNCAFYNVFYSIWQQGNATCTIESEIVNCSFYGAGMAVANERSGTVTLNTVLVNILAADACTNDFANLFGTGGTVTTTGSANNFGENSQFPGAGTPNPITGTTSTSPGAGDWAIYTSSTDLTLVDDADNDVLDAGVGPGSNTVVPDEDILGNARSGSTTDPGAFVIAASGVTISGGVSAATPTVAGTVLHDIQVSGGVTSAAPDVSGGVNVKGAITISGGVTSATPTVAGTVQSGTKISGGVTSQAPDIAAGVQVTAGVSISGGVTAAAPSVAGSLQVDVAISGGVASTAPSVAGGIQVDTSISGGVTSAAPTIAAGVSVGTNITISGGVTAAAPTVAGTVLHDIQVSGGVEAAIPTVAGTVFVDTGNPLDEISEIPGKTYRTLIVEAWLHATWKDPTRPE